MAPPTAFEKADQDRQVLQDMLTYLETKVTDHSTTPLSQLEAERLLQRASNAEEGVITNFSTLCHSAPRGTDMQPIRSQYSTMLDRAIRAHAALHGINNSFRVETITPRTTTHKIKLPPLELPKFSGNLQEWVPFRDLYITAVHNSSLSKVEKLTQLKSLLVGEAARQIRSLVISDANYDVAWESLQDRYENNRELLLSLLRRLFTQNQVVAQSASSLRNLIDTTKECVRSLEVLSLPTEHWDAVLLYILSSKLDSPSRELWEQSLPDSSIPSLQRMYEFLEQRARALAASTTGTQNKHKPIDKRVSSHYVTSAKCKLDCQQGHPLYKCPVFHSYSPEQRKEFLTKHRHCHNCLQPGHLSPDCKSTNTCKKCNYKHHTMIHLSTSSAPPSSSSSDSSTHTDTGHRSVPSVATMTTGEIETAPLATARVLVPNAHGRDVSFRAFIDPGSTVDFVTERLVQKLNLPLFNVSASITGLSECPVSSTKHTTRVTIKPHFTSDVSYTVTALVVKKITGKLPEDKLDSLLLPDGIQLADPSYNQPSPIDILIGSSIFWDSLLDGKIKGMENQPVATNTTFGWLVAGKSWPAPTTAVTSFITNVELGTTLRRFWETEELSPNGSMTPEESACETHFADTHTRSSDGRFTVCIPWKTPRPQLGESRNRALKRLLSLERKFGLQVNSSSKTHSNNLDSTQQQKWQSYKEFMQEYERLGHMSLVPPQDYSSVNAYYIPHHFVEKLSSTTTKLRVVFDASAATTTGASLNSCMMVGPQLQDKLLDIMLRFRSHPIAFTADLEKMYRQIEIHDKDKDLHRILWRESPADPVKEYRLNTVTYGTASAPYLAIKCLQQLAEDERLRFPLASPIALQDFYVDDLASGSFSATAAKPIIRELCQLASAGGFQLRKWVTNDARLLESIPLDMRETQSIINLNHDDSMTVKTLGIMWNTSTDCYQFKVNVGSTQNSQYNKKQVLSEIARIFDQLGLLAPVIMTCKIFMQSLWKLQLDWDDLLPQNVTQQWVEIRESLHALEQLEIPRCVSPGHPISRTLLGFSDASEKAYAAAVYICNTYSDNSRITHLLASKSRVAPVSSETLARLELNSSVLLSELIRYVIRALGIQFQDVRAYTDSMIVYHWINSDALRWKTYVRNRVAAIQRNAPEATWIHIRGNLNPADCASRGIPPAELLNHSLWWNGPPEHILQPTTDLQLDQQQSSSMELERKPVKVLATKLCSSHPIFFAYSSFLRLQRVISWMFRFIENCRKKLRKQPIVLSTLTTLELSSAHTAIIRSVQQQVFSSEYHALLLQKPVSCKSKLFNLLPFIGEDGLIRVGGRLKNASIPFDKKHPILLPRHHHVVSIIIRDTHRSYLHAGPQSILSTLSQRYWILRGKDAVRFVIKKCTVCIRHRANTMNQLMGNLPPSRVNPSRPFSKVGVDYAGPFLLRCTGRSRITLKCWLSIFVCFATRAIHIEVISSLSTDSFIAALRRFTGRRGYPSDIYSDCGTNFKGADKVLRDFIKLCNSEDVANMSTAKGIQWHFIPAGSPHFGGLWEAGVRSVKFHLHRVMGAAKLTYEEMTTLVIQIEAILNSRPLVSTSTDPNDLGVLTPAHFLIGTSLVSPPEPSTLDINIRRLNRFQLIQNQRDQFWKRWSNEFITRLQQRPKWQGITRQLQIGDMVLVKDERLPPLKYKLGRVMMTHPGNDGLTRVATVKTAEGEVKRAITKLCLLPFYES